MVLLVVVLLLKAGQLLNGFSLDLQLWELSFWLPQGDFIGSGVRQILLWPLLLNLC